MEESILSLRGGHPFLNIIDNENVDGLVEIDEIVSRILQHAVGILNLEQPRRDI